MAAKAFASKGMSTAAKYAVKYGVNLSMETLGDAGVQYLTTGEVNWKRAFESGVVDTAIGAAADGVRAVAKNWSSIKAGVKNFIGDELGAVDLSGLKKKNDFKVYYHVTTAENAQKIIESGELRNGKWESNVFAWTQQPTKKQASLAGIGPNSQTVLKFETSASFTRDIGNKRKPISNIVVQTVEGQKVPISITNVEIVGFKKAWWQFWKK